MMKRRLYGGAALLLLGAVAVHLGGRVTAPREPPPTSFVLPADGPLTLAAVGDVVISGPPAYLERNAAFDGVAALIRDASLALGNLEMNLLTPESAEAARRRPGRRWSFGTAREAAALKSIGFDVIGQANHHALDYGTEGMSETRALLTAAGLMTTGSGDDLEEARAPLIVGDGPRRVAVLAVAISSSSAGVATPRRGTSKGWPGINAIRYVAEVTADPATYATLRQAAGAEGAADIGNDQFTLHGTVVRKAVDTSVTLVPDANDVSGILDAIAEARTAADVVVVSLHSHEPSNASSEPAAFVRAFARQAVDAGARLVIGHGPHRLRAVEVYNGGAILHSLGNFLYRPEEGQPLLADTFDEGLDMFSLAMGMGRSSGGDRSLVDVAAAQGAVAVATFDGGELSALQLHPVDLGMNLPVQQKGVPRTPPLPRAVATLETLSRLSQQMGTTIRIENGVGHLQLR
jgi:poly-gamma-glutamate capsule biosynthesis protein CapA/YwtB (metallophosphatase superfamily)